ncbi:response regulator transcription factor [Actinophytocola sp.]|uniref:response regulator transcription factor n=1 Tax=Actinophytocola sp. TaxID=1872138 RepID=UPI002EDB37E4
MRSNEPASGAGKATTRLLLALDSTISSDGIREILRKDPGVTVVGDITDVGERFLRLVSQLRPEVLLVDRDLDHSDGISLAAHVGALLGDRAPVIIVLADVHRRGDVVRAAKAGVRGFLIKNQETWTLGAAVRAVVSGAGWLSPAAAGELIDQVRGDQAEPAESPPTPLTDRERVVVRLVALGFSNTEIAGELTLSESTVKSHVSRMLAKLGLRSRTQLAAFARDHGLV